MNKDKPFHIEIGSPIDYDELVAYICIADAEVALLSQDKGKDHLEIVFSRDPALHRVDYDVFVAALEEAKRKLLR